MLSIPRIGLLLPYHRRPNLGCIPDPKLVSQLGQHPLEPLRVAGCFHAHAHRLLQLSVKLLRLTVAVVQSAFDEFARFRIHHRDLLEPRMKIASSFENQHTRLSLQKLRCWSFDDLESEISGLALEIVNLQFAVLGFVEVCSPVDEWHPVARS